jgi:hypothetical protein
MIPPGQLTAGNAAPQYQCRGNGEPVLLIPLSLFIDALALPDAVS